MLPLLLISFTAAEMLGNHLMSRFDVPEGELLWQHGARGVVAAIAVLVVLVAPPAVGTWLGVRARRAGGGQWATAAWVTNLLLVVMLVVPALVQALVA
jgi:hypothetical protein